ncbi:manganese efflux pump MntP family protein [Myxosarcina sp. GI1]|uniref:manganese efflux pump MntP n=1 Tax=Myxosarcina sp. GI1 TaxID=1541065 RepID=UPI000567E46F|nr:manganese efflux pump MntP family protein [Myxosarcina sp. GI1]
MMNFTIVILALGLAADAFAVSLASGFTIKYLKLNKILKIAVFFGVFQFLMTFGGWLIGLSFREFISEIDHWLAFGLLFVLGSKMIYESNQEEDKKSKFNPLEVYTLIALSIATSIDALAVGISLSILKIQIMLTAVVVGVITFNLSAIGVCLGHYFGNLHQNKVEFAGGAILILIGSKILLEHLIGKV